MSSEEDVWGAAASRPAEPHRAGLDTLGMEKVVSSLRVLNGKSVQLLAAENHEEVESALTRVLGWLHTQIAAPSLHTEASYRAVEEEKKAAELFAVRELSQVYLSWHERRQTMSSRLWMLWVELGCSLDVLRSCEASEEETQSFAVLVMSVPPPRGFPTSESHCNKDKQVVFSRELWEAAVAKPLHGAPAGVFDAAAMKLMEVYLHWMTAAMRGYEVAFIANVAAPLRDHLQASTGNSKLTDTWLKFANFKMSPNGFTKNPASVAVTVVVLSALASASRAPEVVEYLESLDLQKV
ncbi:L-allo-threonine aldolase [Phytophthora cinnamomi]|uniref:L-allo-threonine aldolase n=1 Tax=Phytophthora cinnamomi TaxID=4785 RepID=UPI00355A8FDD|nr:L-allo-threonine aldolase [Phytophthora cinnamomi]